MNLGKVQKNIYIYRKYQGKVYKKQILTIYRNTLWGEPKKKKCLFPIYKKKKAFIGKYTNSGQNKEKERVLFYLYSQNTLYRKHITERVIFYIYIYIGKTLNLGKIQKEKDFYISIQWKIPHI